MKDIRSEVEGFDGHNLLSVKVLLSELEAHLSREPMTSECLTNTRKGSHPLEVCTSLGTWFGCAFSWTYMCPQPVEGRLPINSLNTTAIV